MGVQVSSGRDETAPREVPERDVLTIHMKDYFQGAPLCDRVPRRYWPRLESRIEQTTAEVLDQLDRHDHKATFFVLGWTADLVPDIVAEVARRGHEVASMGYHHYATQRMSPDEFRQDIARSKRALERASGRAVLGYRTPYGWLSKRQRWAFDILADEGFAYDSSICPVGFGHWNSKHLVPFQHDVQSGQLWELPICSQSLFGFRLPISGGNYLRQLPEPLFHRYVERWRARRKQPWMLYFTLWEIDPNQPRFDVLPRIEKLRQYRNLDVMSARIANFLEQHKFGTAADYLNLVPSPVTATEPVAVSASIKTQDNVALETVDRLPVTIVVPCYNEEGGLGFLANTLDSFAADHEKTLDVSYVLVDDGSTDATAERMSEIFGRRTNTRIVRHEANRGVAAAMMTGIKAATTDIVAVIDSDCSYDPAHLGAMIPLIADGADAVTVSPYHRDGAVMNVPGWRLVLSRGLSALYRRALKTKLATYTACVRVYRRSAVADINLRNNGFLGVAEIVAVLDARSKRIVEVPAVLEARLIGHSKMKIMRTIAGHLRLLFELAVLQRHRSKRDVPGQ
ncbi:MAG: glycosyltransferase [Pseudomonadota bacterium]